MSPRDHHHVDPSRATQHDNTSAYRAGYVDARRRMTAGGGKPPRRRSCPITLLLLPLLLLAALWRRAGGFRVGHRHRDPRHDRGEWHSRREEKTPADQQGTGRPWSGARYSDDEQEDTR